LPPVSPVTQSFVLVNVADFDVSPTGDGSLVLRTRARISNVSSAAVRADVFFISAVGAFPLTQVNRTSIVIPPNDVVVFSDVLRQLFATSTARRTGSLEIRNDAQDAHFLTVSAVTYVQQPRGELASLLPVVLRGEGARQGDTYSVPAIISTGFFGG